MIWRSLFGVSRDFWAIAILKFNQQEDCDPNFPLHLTKRDRTLPFVNEPYAIYQGLVAVIENKWLEIA
jgi:hypothetical protein